MSLGAEPDDDIVNGADTGDVRSDRSCAPANGSEFFSRCRSHDGRDLALNSRKQVGIKIRWYRRALLPQIHATTAPMHSTPLLCGCAIPIRD